MSAARSGSFGVRRALAADGVASGVVVPVAIIVGMFALGQVILNGFLSSANVFNVLAFACIIATVTLSQLFVMVSSADGIDLSVGGVMSVSALMLAKICGTNPGNLPMSLLAVIAMGALIGVINHCGIRYLRIPAMIMTMIVWNVLTGFNYYYTKGIVSGDIPEVLMLTGQRVLGPLKTVIFVMLILFALAYLFLRSTRTGKLLFITGSNRNAAALCGVKVWRIGLIAFVMSGVTAALAGVLLLGYSGAAVLKMGDDYVMMSIAAAVIGGTKQGEGSVVGCYLGAVIIQLITSVLVAANMPNAFRILIQGVVLLVILSSFARKPRLQQ